ncbi:MAG TPA: hypothetical protein VL359_07370 [bacterium]|nr:hypothetical protein [bacterium]
MQLKIVPFIIAVAAGIVSRLIPPPAGVTLPARHPLGIGWPWWMLVGLA